VAKLLSFFGAGKSYVDCFLAPIARKACEGQTTWRKSGKMPR